MYIWKQQKPKINTLHFSGYSQLSLRSTRSLVGTALMRSPMTNIHRRNATNDFYWLAGHELQHSKSYNNSNNNNSSCMKMPQLLSWRADPRISTFVVAVVVSCACRILVCFKCLCVYWFIVSFWDLFTLLLLAVFLTKVEFLKFSFIYFDFIVCIF